jgi:taurine dioxygenase
MTIEVTAMDAPCGARVTGVDLSQPLPADDLARIRAAWLRHQVIFFPDQHLEIEELERFAQAMGPFGEDPYIAPIPGHAHVVQVKREPDETTPIFAESWHSDWSFLPSPPAGTVLYGNVIPPKGGDTLFANQYLAWDELPAELRRAVDGRMGIHSARRGYAPQGMYGEKDKGRSMAIRWSESALRTQLHPIGRVHPETGRTALFVSPGYTIGIEGMPDDEAHQLLMTLFRHQCEPRFVYRHRWSEGMLTLWDNRCLVHAATGGYEGHRRLLHRITVGERVAA